MAFTILVMMYCRQRERLGTSARVSQEELLLLKTAALFHDIGYTQGTEGHEERGAKIVAEELPPLGYTTSQVQRVTNLILATKMPQTPQDYLEKAHV